VRGRRQDVASVPSFARLRATNKEEPPPPSTPPSRCTRAGPSRPPGWSTIDARPDTHTHTLTHTGDRPGVRVQLRTHACSAVVVLVNPSVNQPAHGRRSIDDAACLPACLPCPPARPRPSPTFHGRAALSPSPPPSIATPRSSPSSCRRRRRPFGTNKLTFQGGCQDQQSPTLTDRQHEDRPLTFVGKSSLAPVW
jgi:hypothetical protein